MNKERIQITVECMGPLPTVGKYDQTSTRLAAPVLVLFSIFEWGICRFAFALHTIDANLGLMYDQIAPRRLSSKIIFPQRQPL